MNTHILEGQERIEYLSGLSSSLRVLANGIANGDNKATENRVIEYGNRKKWDFSRLPVHSTTYSILGNIIKRIAAEYSWLADILSKDDIPRNRAYFDKLRISSESGLPEVFNFVELERLKNNARVLLDKNPTYAQSALSLTQLLLDDTTNIDEVGAQAIKIQKNALKRNFLEQLSEVELIGWRLDGSGIYKAEKIIPQGGEDLWNLMAIKFNPTIGEFEAYSIDLWQDLREPQLIEENGSVIISDKLKQSLVFGESNQPWFILKSIDDIFGSLHPVHVSRAFIGPFENRYKTTDKEIKSIPVLKGILSGDKSASFLRFKRTYSFAPNHHLLGEEVRQIVEQETFSDELIVSPSSYSTKVSNGLLGMGIRVIELGEIK